MLLWRQKNNGLQNISNLLNSLFLRAMKNSATPLIAEFIVLLEYYLYP